MLVSASYISGVGVLSARGDSGDDGGDSEVILDTEETIPRRERGGDSYRQRVLRVRGIGCTQSQNVSGTTRSSNSHAFVFMRTNGSQSEGRPYVSQFFQRNVFLFQFTQFLVQFLKN